MRRFLLALFAASLLISQTTGCAISPKLREAIMDPGKEERQRKEEIRRLVDERHITTRLQAASTMLESGRYDDCLHALSEVAKLDPDCKEMFLLKAEVHMSRNEFDDAAAIYANLLNDFPNDANLHHLHAMALEFSGDSAGAMLAFQRAAEISPDSSLIQLSQFDRPETGTIVR
ncbi:tetratricopeptide repeat protein [Bremerella sp. JC817]|uniref:tetratricopeptide repeat protein n=1 Tax=Bremerella sp. JC817 TaxID=3231756 RepID=UPI00345A2B34